MGNSYKLIALDIDGTILPKNNQISSETKRLIATAREQGIEITLSTGRHINSIAETFAKELNISFPMVTLNGGEVWTPSHELLARTSFSNENIVFLYELAKEYQADYLGFTNEGLFMKEQFPSDFNKHTWLKFVYFIENLSVLNTVWNILHASENFTLTNSAPINIEVNPRGVSKASGLKMICEIMGINRSQVIAIGDGMNDMEAIQWAGLGIAMGNAPYEVQRAADFVTDTCENEGVAKAIEKVLGFC